MILPFSNQLKGKPTYFVEKIIKCITGPMHIELIPVFMPSARNRYDFNDQVYQTCKPKLHTIREDAKNRWRVGMKIHPAVNNRTKRMLIFEPTLLTCVSTQKIEIRHYGQKGTTRYYNIIIDDRRLDAWETNLLAVNDGFENTEEFINVFCKDFTGKIIHWTNIKY